MNREEKMKAKRITTIQSVSTPDDYHQSSPCTHSLLDNLIDLSSPRTAQKFLRASPKMLIICFSAAEMTPFAAPGAASPAISPSLWPRPTQRLVTKRCLYSVSSRPRNWECVVGYLEGCIVLVMEDEESVFAFFVGLPELVFLVNFEHNFTVFDWVMLELGKRLFIDEKTSLIATWPYMSK